MKKLICLSALWLCGSVFADSNIVFLTSSKIFANSQVLTQLEAKSQANYKKQQDSLLATISEQEKKLAQKNLSEDQLNLLSLKLNDLQQKYSELSNQSTVEYNAIKNDYMVYVKKAVQELYDKNHYSYVLNSSSVVMTDPNNDISILVSQEADRIYKQEK